MRKNIFVVGLDRFNLAQLEQLGRARDYRYHALGSYAEVKSGKRFPVREILQKSIDLPGHFEGSIDAIIGYWDFPVSTLLPLLRRPHGLPGASLEATLKCEHKYWSRKLQKQVIPDVIPEFKPVDPFGDRAGERIGLDYPYWLKPVKSLSSYLGFLIHDRGELEQSLALIRGKIERLAEPFNFILHRAELPADIAGIDGYHCIAEALISAGEQCTLEGYVQNGETRVYGVVDSIREGRHRSSFARYQYPSCLPEPVQRRMIDATANFMEAIGYDDSPFNAEYYWDRETDRIWLLEINTRISKSHCPLFKLVDGEYHHAIAIELALGRKPSFPRRRGSHEVAAKFMLRSYKDGKVNSIPSDADIEGVKARFPGTEVFLHVKPGMKLSELREQDSYSFETAVLYMGAGNEEQLLENYQAALGMLPFDIGKL